MVVTVVQPDFFGGMKLIKGKRRPRNSSFQARCFLQLKELDNLYVDIAEFTLEEFMEYYKEITLQLHKVHLLVEEKENGKKRG